MKKISTQFILSIALISLSLFTYAGGQLTIASVSPTTGAAGSTVTMTVTGGGSPSLNFSTSATGCACTSGCMQIATGVYSGLLLSSGVNAISGINITAVNGSSFTCSFTIPSTQAAGAYTITISDPNGSCIGFKNGAFTVTGGTSGIQSIENSNFNLFPNPSKGIFDVQLNNFTANNYADVIDLLGRNVGTYNLTAEKTQIDASRLGKGVYFISIRNENGVIGRQKFVIE